MALGVAAVVLVQMALRAAAMPEVVAREDLSAALSVALLGLVAVVTRRDATGQMLGFMTAASGCTLAAVALPGLPVAAVLAGLTLLGTPALGVVLIRRLPAP
jgi:hydrogenase-4 component E